MSNNSLLEHFFRREYGKLVAALSRRVGVQHLETVEDAVQSALMTALESWPRSKVPDSPSAWLYRVAHNNLIGDLRKQTGRDRLLTQNTHELLAASAPAPEHSLAGELNDDLLRMLFVCCDHTIAPESQLVLALKILCGFSVQEIALRLFISEANTYKRLSRARGRLREHHERFDERRCDLNDGAIYDNPARLEAVHRILYLLFTEGHLSSHAEFAIRLELCDEAMRLANILVDHPLGANPQTRALLALMHLHLARMAARQSPSGGLLLLEEQDRARWDKGKIARGLQWLASASEGNHFSRYHAEAGIAAEHCLAPSFKETRWERIVECYLLLEQASPSPLHTLNRALALAEWQGPAAGLAIINSIQPPSWLDGSYLWAAVMADLLRRCGSPEAQRYREQALQTAPNQAIQTALRRRLKQP